MFGRRSLLTLVTVFLLLCFCLFLICFQKKNNYFNFWVKKRNEAKINDLKNKIILKVKKEAPKFYIPPQDAYLDPVFCAIPGYNGICVDLEKTLKKTFKLNKNIQDINNLKIYWVYKEIEPKITLYDLADSAIFKGNNNKKAVALMFNVAWGTEYIEQLLEILENENVKATFFLDGSWLQNNVSLAKRIVYYGHEIGNHGYSHPLMSKVSNERIEREINKTNELIKNILGLKCYLFAPPAGDYDERVVKIAKKHSMLTILWTTDTIDWKKSSFPEIIVERVRDNLGAGHLILMHPTFRTVKALPLVIKVIRQRGLLPIPVSDVLSSKRLSFPSY